MDAIGQRQTRWGCCWQKRMIQLLIVYKQNVSRKYEIRMAGNLRMWTFLLLTVGRSTIVKSGQANNRGRSLFDVAKINARKYHIVN